MIKMKKEFVYYLGTCKQFKHTAFSTTIEKLQKEIGLHVGTKTSCFRLRKTKKEACRKSMAYYKLDGYKPLILIDRIK
jgi:hypothetical protein